MTINDFLINTPENSLSSLKWHSLKQSIVKLLLSNGDMSLLELSTQLQSSIPTITKAVNELLIDELIIDSRKVSSSGKKKSSHYKIRTDKTFFLGIEANRSSTSFGLQNLNEDFVLFEAQIPFVLKNSLASLIEFCDRINSFIIDNEINKSYITGVCINLSGRVNSLAGYSHNYFGSEDRSLVDIIAEKINLPVYLENDTRAMTLGEFARGVVDKEQNILFLNYSWGVGICLLAKGELYYGKSGYAGEFGHSPIFNNEILCHCGKVGCLETEVSGWALVEQFKKEIAKGRTTGVHLDPAHTANQHYQCILNGVLDKEDSLCVELITQQCEKMGRALATLVNVLNPELLIIGGDFSQLDDFVLLPIQSNIKKYTIAIVNSDMRLKKSILGNKAGVIGACRIVKDKMILALTP